VWNCVISALTAGFARCGEHDERGTNFEIAIHSGTYIDLEELVYIIVHDQAVRQTDSVRLHRVASHVGIVADVRVVEVGDSLLCGINDIKERYVSFDARLVGGSRHRGRSRVESNGRRKPRTAQTKAESRCDAVPLQLNSRTWDYDQLGHGH
jgi:hypothetical protein